MSNQKESIARTLLVALLVCLVCSVFVAGAAVLLKPAQQENRQLDRQRSILAIAGLGDAQTPAAEVRTLFGNRIRPRLVDLQTGQFSEAHDASTFDALKAAREPSQSSALSGEQDVASIRRREQFTTVYWVADEKGQLETLVLPVRGYGLWSTLHGFVALKADLNTVSGFGFYQHAETPGLGGEVDNPKWKALWPGKTLFDANGLPVIALVKGGVDPQNPQATHQVDALAGATLTSKGVQNLLHFWLGNDGFGPFLAHLRKGEI